MSFILIAGLLISRGLCFNPKHSQLNLFTKPNHHAVVTSLFAVDKEFAKLSAEFKAAVKKAEKEFSVIHEKEQISVEVSKYKQLQNVGNGLKLSSLDQEKL